MATVLTAVDPIHIPEALQLLRRAVELHNDSDKQGSAHEQLAALLTDVGVRLKLAGLPANAILNYEEALSVCPHYSAALYNLAVAHADSGEPDIATQFYDKCLKQNPSHVEAWCNLGVLHRNKGRHESAMQAYQSALRVNPNFELAKRNLAVALCESATQIKRRDPRAARKLYKRALALQPCLAHVHYNLGVLYAEMNKFERALVSYNLAVKFDPRYTQAYNNLGVVHKELGNMPRALDCYQMALQCDAKQHQTHNNIAVVYTLMGNVESASMHLRIANQLCPQYAEAHNNIGVLLRDQGDIDAAISHYERCYTIDARADMAAQNRLHALSYSEQWTKAGVYEEHLKWGMSFQQRIDNEIIKAAEGSESSNPIAKLLRERIDCPPHPDPSQPRGPGTMQPLRIGYLSPDFFTHSVSYFAEVLMKQHDRQGFMVFAYANVAQPDGKTDHFREMIGNKWRNIWGMTASVASKLILDDKIDILIELAGHTANNRLDIMALRLAPIQVTWIGYPNTTGMKTIHYRVTDGTVDPRETTQPFSEKLWRLPDAFLCYTPSHEAPEQPSPPPLLESGGIVTFGSFNVLAKIQSRVVRLWAAILSRVPNSRLLLKAKPFAAESAKRRMEDLFKKEGIDADRLDLVPLIPSTRSHLEVYSNVDLALDPFPYAGTTTTCEAMYMGVPTITLGTRAVNGDHAHNVGVSLNSVIGHPELVAYSDEEYIEKAVSLGSNLEQLTTLRKNLRKDMMASGLGQGERYMCNVERMFCSMWRAQGGKLGDLMNEKVSLDAEFESHGAAPSSGHTTPVCPSGSESSEDASENEEAGDCFAKENRG